MYRNGKLCAEKELDRQRDKPNNQEDFQTINILTNTQGYSIIDEVKVHSSFPSSDSEVDKTYNEEKSRFMS